MPIYIDLPQEGFNARNSAAALNNSPSPRKPIMRAEQVLKNPEKAKFYVIRYNVDAFLHIEYWTGNDWSESISDCAFYRRERNMSRIIERLVAKGAGVNFDDVETNHPRNTFAIDGIENSVSGFAEATKRKHTLYELRKEYQAVVKRVRDSYPSRFRHISTSA